MKEHNRVTPEGRALGEQMVRLLSPAIMDLALQGEPDARCVSCAFRYGTVPNGCPQTQMDALKAALEGSAFLCHMDPSHRTTCHGRYAARVALQGATRTCPWEFSPPDDETAP